MAARLFMILDDITVLFDDMAAMTKLTAQKTAGVLADDLAVGAQKASGFHSSRELHVIWNIALGSFKNKLIILPFAFLLSAFVPQLIVPILLMGALYLSFEGAEKVVEFALHSNRLQQVKETLFAGAEALAERERQLVRSAILTDFILSIEIIVIALGVVASEPISTQIVVVSTVAVLATIAVYGIVALLVRMDDFGLSLLALGQKTQGLPAALASGIGRGLIATLPILIRILTLLGTLAMLLVGGGIFVHNLDWVHHLTAALPVLIAELLVGLVMGLLVVALLKLVSVFKSGKTNNPAA